MDKELLKAVIDNIVNEDDDAAKAAFKTYALGKVQSVLEASSLAKKAKKVEDDQKPDCDEEEAAKKVIADSNADD